MNRFPKRFANICVALFILTCLFSNTLKAQTTLIKGDIAFTGYFGNGVAPSLNDQFSFVLLTNITNNTVINFTDNAWLRTGPTTGSFRAGEGTVTYTNTTGGTINAGTEILITITGAATATATFVGGLPAGTATGAVMPSLSTNGDQVIAYQGTTAAPTFICAIHMNVYSVAAVPPFLAGGDPVTTTTTDWDGATSTANASGLPGLTGSNFLTNGVDAIWIPGSLVAEKDNARFNCTGPLGTAAQVRTAIYNVANWQTNDDDPSVGPPVLTLPTGCSYITALPAPAFTLQPLPSTICAGSNTSFTVTATNALSYQWQVDNGGGFANITDDATYSGAITTTLTITAAPSSLNGYLYRCVATNATTSTNSNSAALTVTALPVNPTLLAKIPTSATVADGTPVSATFNAGSGGTGCADDYRYTTDGGATYLAYTPGSNISTTGVAAGSGFVFIEGRRANCTSLCQSPYQVLASWSVTPLPAAPTTLNAGDIAFSGYFGFGASVTPDEFSFVLLRNIGPGTVINFTNNGWLSTNVFRVGEETVTWTSPATALPAGTEIKIVGTTATRSGGGAAGSVAGTPLSLSANGDQILAYRGTVAAPTFISAIHMNVYSVANGDATTTSAAAWDGAANTTNASALPTGLTTGTNCIWIGTSGSIASEFDNARFGNCTLSAVAGSVAALRTALNTQTNWIRSNGDPAGFTLPTGCNYLAALAPSINVTGTPLAAFSSCSGAASAEQNFTVSGNLLTADIILNAPAGFEISTTSGSGFSASLTLVQSGGIVNPTIIYVRLTAAASGTPSGNITVASTGITTVDVAVSGTVNNPSVAPTSITGTTTICSPNSTTLTAVGGTLGTGANYQWGTGAVVGTTPIGGATSSTLLVTPGGNTTYWVRIENTAAPCTGSTTGVTQLVTVNQPSVAPTGATGITTICTGASTTLTVTGGSQGTGATTQWFTGSCGGTLVFTGDALNTGALVTTTTYFVRYTGTCNTTTCATVTVTVNDVTGGTVGSDQSILSPADPAAFTQTVASTGSGTLTYQWQSSTTSCAAGFSNIGGANSTTYDPPAGLLLTTYYRRVTTSTLNTVACTANSNCITVTVFNCTFPTISCPANISLSNTAGQCNRVVTYSTTVTGTPAPVVTYAFTGATLGSGSGNGSGSTFNVGVTNVTVTATNICGAPFCTFTVTINDTQAPTVTTGTIAACYPTVAAAQAAALAATSATDNCPGVLTEVASTVGTCSAVVTVRTTDVASNFTDVTYNTRIDNTAPTVTVGTIASCYPTVAAAEAAALAATSATDNCPGALTEVASTVGTCSAVITVTTTDGCGNATAITYNTRIDNTAPTVTVGTIASCYPTVAAAEAAALAATSATDNCPGALTEVASTVGTCSAVITVTTTDGCGNATAITYNTRIDNTAPTVTVGTIASCYPTVAAAEAAALAATSATDNCPGALTEVASTVGTCSAVITVTTTDGCGNATAITYNTRIDNTAPTVTVGTIASCYPTVAAAEAAALAATSATDNCPGALTEVASTVGTCSAVITVTTTDGCGNATAITYNTRIDNTAPTVTVGTIASCYPTVAAAEAAALAATSATDNCPGALTEVASTVGTCSAVITVTTTDGCGNATAITYNTRIDNTPPTLTCPAAVVVCGPGAVPAVDINTVTNVSDNCPGAIIVTHQGDVSTPSPTTPYVITRTYRATDGCGNFTECTQLITVNPIPNAVATPASQTVCSANPIATIVLTGAVSGTTYNWTRDNTAAVTGIAASGSGDISGTLNNTTVAPVTVTFTITPTANGCAGTPVTATVTVNPTPTVNPVASITVCNGTIVPTIVFSGAVPGTVFNWTNSNTTIGIPSASGSGNILSTSSQVHGSAASNNNNFATITFGVRNDGATPLKITGVNANLGDFPGPVFAGVVQTRLLFGPVNGAGALTGTNDISTWTATPIQPINVNVSSYFQTTFVPIPPADQFILLPGEARGIAVQSTNGNFMRYANGDQTTTNGTVGIISNGHFAGGAVPVLGNTPRLFKGSVQYDGSFTAINLGTAPEIATIVVTPSYTNAGTTCNGTSTSFTITVNPTPTAVATPASQTVCSANPITTIVLTGAVSGTTYAWTRDNTASVTGIAASGSGNISGTLTNTTFAPVTVTFTITPTANGCAGPSITATVLVNPTPNAFANPSSQTVCSANPITTIVLTGNVAGTTFNWTRNNTATVTGIAASGSGDIAGTLTNTTFAPITVTFTITPTANGCPGTPITATVLVNPTPNAIATPASQTICSGNVITTIALTGNVTGTTYAWTRDNTVAVTGIAASGTGNSIAGTLTNTTPLPVTVTFTITPTANGCAGPSITATVLVNPLPVMTALPAAQTICNGVTITPIVFASTTPGTTYTWTRDNSGATTAPGGIQASGSGPSITGFMINTTFAPITVTFTITPTFAGCVGTPVTATVTIQPTPTAVATPATQVSCSGSPIATINLTGLVAGTVYNWTRDNVVAATGIAASGTGNISGTLTTTGTTPVVVTFTITPSINGCNGPSIIATDTIYPTPSVNQPGNQVVCNGGATTAVAFTGTVAGTVFNWTNNTPSIGLAATGTGNIPVFTAVNTTNAPVTATITVTPVVTSTGCVGVARTFTITVNPTATVGIVPNQTLCTGSSTAAINFTSTVAGTTFSWTNNTPSIGLAASGTGNIPSFIAINTTPTAVTATITVTPNTAAGCIGVSTTFTITVNGNSVAPTGATASVTTNCGPTTTTLTVVGGALGTGASWRWYSGSCGGTLVGTGASITIPVNTTTTYFVRAEGTCNTTGCGTSVTVTINTIPTISIAAAPFTALTPLLRTNLTATVSPTAVGNVVEWFKDNGPLPIATGLSINNINVDQVGSYRARVTTAQGCTATSNTVEIRDSATGQLFVYPNPNNGKFQIRYYLPENSISVVRKVGIFDSEGRLVYNERISVQTRWGSMNINLLGAAQGSYFIKILDVNDQPIVGARVQILR